MLREVFATRFAASARRAWQFAQSLVCEDLPPTLVFLMRLNQSYDAHPAHPGEVRYPQDGSRDRAVTLRRCDMDTVLGELWRDGRVPEWVDLTVVDETGTATVVEVVCCGRFTNDEARLYHAGEGAPPFHVLGPALPKGYDGTPFSVHTRAECWDRADLQHLTTVAERVWSLSLMTDEFDSDRLDALPDLPNMGIFEHHACALGADAMSAFTRFANLRVLRLYLASTRAFNFSADAGSRSSALTSITLTNLPARPWGHQSLATAAPSASTMEFRASGTLWLDGIWPSPVRRLILAATTIAGSTRMPDRLDHLSIHLSEGNHGLVGRPAGQHRAHRLVEPARHTGHRRHPPVSRPAGPRASGSGRHQRDTSGARAVSQGASKDRSAATGGSWLTRTTGERTRSAVQRCPLRCPCSPGSGDARGFAAAPAVGDNAVVIDTEAAATDAVQAWLDATVGNGSRVRAVTDIGPACRALFGPTGHPRQASVARVDKASGVVASDYYPTPRVGPSARDGYLAMIRSTVRPALLRRGFVGSDRVFTLPSASHFATCRSSSRGRTCGFGPVSPRICM